MAATVYILCAVTSLLCAVLLWRGYRSSRTRLLLSASVCFIGLALNNIMVVVDLVLVPETDLFIWRTMPAVLGMGFLLYGLIGEAK